MKKIILNEEYSFNDIEKYAKEKDFEITEYGVHVGENFLVLKHNEKDITLSFILTGCTSKNYIYKLIYSDIQNSLN